MTKTETRRLVDKAGGDLAFARLIGLDPSKDGVAQRVNNWKRRGLPSAVELEHYDTLQELKDSASRTSANSADTATA